MDKLAMTGQLLPAVNNQHATEKRPLSAEGAVEKRKEEIREVAKEMESLFALQLLKVMRETTESMTGEKKGNGYSTYMGLFDMEVSKLFADRGMGLQDAIVNWLERMPQEVENINNDINDADKTKEF
jgi:Rod binding domain-containing protein